MELLEAFETIRSASYDDLKSLLHELIIEEGSSTGIEMQYIVLREIMRRNEIRKRTKPVTMLEVPR